MIELKTHPDLITLLLRGMKVAKNQQIVVDTNGHVNDNELWLLQESQRMIGWDKLRLGFWSTQWKTVQALYIK